MKEILLEQFKATFNKANWFVPLITSIEGLAAKDASLKINEENNSVEQILFHLIYWNNLYLKRFENENFQFAEISNNETFTNIDNLNWEQTIDKIYTVFNEWEKCLSSTNEAKLNTAVTNTSKIWHSVIANIIIHNAYHIGQIVAIRKFNNCWDNEKGVN